jgi:cell division protein ZapE
VWLVFQPLAAADYLALAEAFDVVLIRDIPRLTLANKSEARRFITLIDTFYDRKVKLAAVNCCCSRVLITMCDLSSSSRV